MPYNPSPIDKKGVKQCKYCGELIVFLHNPKSGKWVAVNWVGGMNVYEKYNYSRHRYSQHGQYCTPEARAAWEKFKIDRDNELLE